MNEKNCRGCRTSVFDAEIAVTNWQIGPKRGDSSSKVELRHPCRPEVPKFDTRVPKFNGVGVIDFPQSARLTENTALGFTAAIYSTCRRPGKSTLALRCITGPSLFRNEMLT